MTRKSLSGWKPMKVLIRKAVAQGWKVTQTGHGFKWLPPAGDEGANVTPIFSSATPSDHRALKNHIARMRKAGFQS